MGESARTIQDKRNTSPFGACISMGSTHRSADHTSCYIPLLFHCLFRTVPCAFVLKKHTCEYTYMHMFARGSFCARHLLYKKASAKCTTNVAHFCARHLLYKKASAKCTTSFVRARACTKLVVHFADSFMYNKCRAQKCVPGRPRTFAHNTFRTNSRPVCAPRLTSKDALGSGTCTCRCRSP